MIHHHTPPRTRPLRDMARLFWAGLQYPGEAAAMVSILPIVGLIYGVLG